MFQCALSEVLKAANGTNCPLASITVRTFALHLLSPLSSLLSPLSMPTLRMLNVPARRKFPTQLLRADITGSGAVCLCLSLSVFGLKSGNYVSNLMRTKVFTLPTFRISSFPSQSRNFSFFSFTWLLSTKSY